MKRHVEQQHPRRYSEYQSLSLADKIVFFPDDKDSGIKPRQAKDKPNECKATTRIMATIRTKPSSRESPYEMVDVDQAIETVLKETRALEVATLPLEEALGLVVAEPIVNHHPIPAFRASVMDGYAVVASDGVGQYPVMERITAGRFPTHRLLPGQVSYITTGAPVPEGADAVVPIEQTRGVDNGKGEKPGDEETAVEILQQTQPNQFIRAVGSDLAVGAQLVQAQEIITPAEIGLLASAGISHVKVYRRPIVGVLSSGNELVGLESTPMDASTSGGKIRDSNRPMLLSMLQQFAKVQVVDLGILVDDQSTTRERLTQVLSQVDVLITSGGVSMGEFDFIKPFLEEHGTVHFGRVHMKPGKPTTFASIAIDNKKNKTFVFALPGNPVSCFVTFHLFVTPALARLAGVGRSLCHLPRVEEVVLTHTLAVDPLRPEYHRARVYLEPCGSSSVQWKATSTSVGCGQPSSQLMNCHTANALLKIPVGSKPLAAGSRVEALLIGMENSTAMALLTPVQVPTQEMPKPSGCPCCSASLHASSASSARAAAPSTATSKFNIRVGILTISDRVSSGEAIDASGPMLTQLLAKLQDQAGPQSIPFHYDIVQQVCVADEIHEIQEVVKRWSESTNPEQRVDLICTSGGTGLSPRDVTPEALLPLFDKELPGFAMAMLQKGMQATPKAILSRTVCGIRQQTLIVTFPGKPKAVQENFEALESVLGHALLLIRDEPHDHHVGKRQATLDHLHNHH